MIRMQFPRLSPERASNLGLVAGRRTRRQSFRLEPLEGRLLLTGGPTDYTVNTTSGGYSGTGDSGSLAYVINLVNANTNSAGSLMNFAPSVFPAGQVTTIYLSSAEAPLAISSPDLVIIGNGDVGISGNGHAQVISVTSTGDVGLNGVTISGGSAANGGGIDNAGNLSIDGCEITDNTASIDGGDIFNSGTMTITMSTVSDGSAPGGGGIENTGKLTMTSVTLSGNTAGGSGGGLENAGTTDILEAMFDDDTANAGGGIFNASGTLGLCDATVAGNSATTQGGGIVDAGTLTAVNDTIVSNTALASGTGGGVSVTSPDVATLSNTIVALNLAGTGSSAVASDIGGTVASSSSYNLIGTGGAGGLTNGAGGNQVGVASSAVGLSPAGLANNGGSLETIALLPTSPAVDAGSAALAFDTVGDQAILYDARGVGFSRTNPGGLVDIGAYELLTAAPITGLTVSTQPPAYVAPNADFGLAVTVNTSPGEVDTTYNGPVTIALVGPTSATLGGTLTVDAANGVATFSGLSLNDTGTYTIQATVGAATIKVVTSAIIVQGPPQIVSESMLTTGKGASRKITGIKLVFNEALSADSANNPPAYAVTQSIKQGKKMITEAVGVAPSYSASSDSVTLKFAIRPTFALGGKLVVMGTGSNRLTSASGIALGGTSPGKGGKNATFTILANGSGI